MPSSLLFFCGLGVALMAGRAAASRVELGVPSGARDDEEQEGSNDGGMGLRRYLLTKYKEGRMTAADITGNAFHSMRAGALGVGDLALDPKKSAHAAEFVRTALHIQSLCKFYYIDLPVWDNEQNRRTHIRFPVNLPHEQFALSWADDPGAWSPLNFSLDEWPVGFADNEAGQGNKVGRRPPHGFKRVRPL